MSKKTAAGMWAMRYSAKPSRFNVGKCHEPSTTTSSRLPTRSASQSVVTNSGLAVCLSSAMGERSAKTGPGATRSGGAEPVDQRPHFLDLVLAERVFLIAAHERLEHQAALRVQEQYRCRRPPHECALEERDAGAALVAQVAVEAGAAHEVEIAACHVALGDLARELHDAVFGMDDQGDVAPRGNVVHRVDEAGPRRESTRRARHRLEHGARRPRTRRRRSRRASCADQQQGRAWRFLTNKRILLHLKTFGTSTLRSSQAGTGRPFSRRNAGLKSFDS